MTNLALQIDRETLIATLQALVRINSVNPTLVPGAPGEAEIGAYTAAEYEKLGLEVRIHEIEPGRLNVTGVLPGAGGGRSLLLNAHMDTVGVDGMTIDPFGAEIRAGRMYGRGTQDMKASLAAMMAAVKALRGAGITLRGDLILAAVADEEHSSLGTEALVRELRADGAIVTEPTDLSICRAHRGFQWYEIETFGRAAHGSRYREGIDANLHMGRVLAELDVLAKELLLRTPHPLMGPPSLNAALLNGGTEVSIYADRCLLQMERRTISGESREGCLAELQAILDRQAAKDPQFRADLRFVFERRPFEVPAEAPVVAAVERAAGQVLGKPPAHTGQTFWTDAALHADAGTETVLIGPVGAGLHSAEEWVDIESVVQLAEILARAAVEYCGLA